MERRYIEYYRVKYTLFVLLFASFLMAGEALHRESSRSHWIKLGAYALVILLAFALPKRNLLAGTFLAVVSFRAVFGYVNTRNALDLVVVLGAALGSALFFWRSALKEKAFNLPGYSLIELPIDVVVVLVMLRIGILLT